MEEEKVTVVFLLLAQIFRTTDLQNCPPSCPSPQVAVTHPSSYAERLKLCKVLRGFQVRSITINRAVKYMNAGDDAQPTS